MNQCPVREMLENGTERVKTRLDHNYVCTRMSTKFAYFKSSTSSAQREGRRCKIVAKGKAVKCLSLSFPPSFWSCFSLLEYHQYGKKGDGERHEPTEKK